MYLLFVLSSGCQIEGERIAIREPLRVKNVSLDSTLNNFPLGRLIVRALDSGLGYALNGLIALQITLIVPLSTQVYEWVPGNLMPELDVILASSFRVVRNFPFPPVKLSSTVTKHVVMTYVGNKVHCIKSVHGGWEWLIVGRYIHLGGFPLGQLDLVMLKYSVLTNVTLVLGFTLAILIHCPAGYRRIRQHENRDAVSSSPHQCTIWYGLHTGLYCLP